MTFRTYFSWLIVITISLCLYIGFVSTKSELKVKGKEPNYAAGTPAYDSLTLTNGEVMSLGHNQKAVVIGVDVMYLWLGLADDKEIISITAFNRGPQGSTSSFLIVYLEK